MEGADGIVFASVLDGRGGGRMLDWSGVRAWRPDEGPLWIHLDYSHEVSRDWLRGESGLDPIVCEALLAEDPRPRALAQGDGLLLIVRAVNLNEGAEPEDMVAVRMWIQGHRIVTMRHRKLNAVRFVREALSAGRGPSTAGDVAVSVLGQVLEKIVRVVDRLDEEVDALEDQVLTAESFDLRRRLSHVRRRAIGLRRFVVPQRTVFASLQNERASWLSDVHRARFRELAEGLARSIEEIDAARERAAVTQEELGHRLSEQMNRTMYVLSLVAAVFLPLGLLTGLFGVNVGGIPLQTNQWGFWLLGGLLVALSGVQLWVFRRLEWL